MPALKPDTDLYPEDLLQRPEVETRDNKRWWVLTTKPRRNKQVMRALFRGSLPFYAPLIPHGHRTPKGRILKSYPPLFPNYIFFHGDKEADLTVPILRKLAQTMPVTDPAGLTRELRQICQLIASGVPLTLENRLRQGVRVRIRTGPFKGFEGILIKKSGNDHLVIDLEFVKATVSFEADKCEFEVVEKFVPRPEEAAASRQAEKKDRGRRNPAPIRVRPKYERRRSGIRKRPPRRMPAASAISLVSPDARSSKLSATHEKKSILEYMSRRQSVNRDMNEPKASNK